MIPVERHSACRVSFTFLICFLVFCLFSCYSFRKRKRTAPGRSDPSRCGREMFIWQVWQVQWTSVQPCMLERCVSAKVVTSFLRIKGLPMVLAPLLCQGVCGWIPTGAVSWTGLSSIRRFPGSIYGKPSGLFR